MSIRIRTVNGATVALCAVESDEMPGDIYLDDAAHHALFVKFALDFESEGVPVPWDHTKERALMESQKVRDAKEELMAWIDGAEGERKAVMK